MPRMRGKQQWRPLSISHDIAARGTIDRPEEAVAVNNVSNIHDGVTVFVETLYSMAYPHPLECYASDYISPGAAVIFFVKPEIYNADRTSSGLVLMCNFGDIQEGTSEVLGSAMRLPEGSAQAQQILFIRFGEELFSVVLWCSRQRNWSHLATFHDGSEKITVLYQDLHWNFSTIEFFNTHATQFGGLERLYRLGTGNAAYHDDFVFESASTDPFGPALRVGLPLTAQHTVEEDARYQLSTTHSTGSSSTTRAPPMTPTTSADTLHSYTPFSDVQYRHEYADTIMANENTPASHVSWTQQAAPSHQPQTHAYATPVHYMPTSVQQQSAYAHYPPYTWTSGYTPPGWPSYNAAYAPGAVQWPQGVLSSSGHPSSHGHFYGSGVGYATPYDGRSRATSALLARSVSRPYLHSVRESPQSPTVAARTVAREAIMKMPEQAMERNKGTSMDRTVLYDPYRDQDRTSLRAEAPMYASPEAAVDRTFSQTPLDETRIATHATVQALAEAMRSKTATPMAPCTLLSTLGANVGMPVATYKPQVAPIGAARPSKTEPWETPQDLKDSVSDSQSQSKPVETVRIMCPALAGQYTRQDFNGPFFTNELFSPEAPVARPQKSRDEKLNDWWWSGNNFARQEAFYQSLMAVKAPNAGSRTDLPQKLASPLKVAVPRAASPRKPKDPSAVEIGRFLVPVHENLAAYVEGPIEKRRDYWCQWVKAPEWCCDRSAEGAKSFFDEAWGNPPARIGRDARYRNMPRSSGHGTASPRGIASQRRMAFNRF